MLKMAINQSTDVTLIIPTRNEERFIGKVLDSLCEQDYPLDKIEILVVDGCSSDRTISIAEGYKKKLVNLRIVDNFQKFTPYAFNVGIREASSNVVIFMGAHTTYSKNYVSTIVKYISSGVADCVGSVAETKPASNGFMAKYIIAAITSKFGVGNSHMRTGVKEPKYVDTASCSGYDKKVFEKIGLFNEKLIHSQDIEFNLRMKRAGFRTLLVPEITSYYYARTDLKTFIKYNFKNGTWVILPFAHSNIIPVSLRHLVPLAFVSGLLGPFLLGLKMAAFKWLFWAVIVSYFSVSTIVSIQIAWKRKKLTYVFVMPFIFSMLHIGYGLGSLYGVIKMPTLPEFWRKIIKKGKCYAEL